MSVGDPFWARHFRRVAIPQVEILIETLDKRILPSFANLEVEAQEYTDRLFQDLGSRPAFDDSVDMADLAEIAQEGGLARYEALTGVQQAILNALTVALHHMLEQELLLFLRRHVLHPREEPDLSLARLPVLYARLREQGMEVERLNGWKKLQELALVANTIKHADGRSAGDLRPLRPDLFVQPILRTTRLAGSARDRPVYRPMAGDDLYVSEDDFKGYCHAGVSFLEDFAAAIE